MKFCLKQKIVTPQSTVVNDIEKVGGVTEYEALRAEKLFRYEYSNQLNTSLLTFAFTVFTAGLIIFTLLVEFGGMFNPNSDKKDVASYNITINSTKNEAESDFSIEINNSTDDNEQEGTKATEEENTSKGNTEENNIQTEPNGANDQNYVVFVEYFFACFFLLPCFFSRINFRYTVKNSLRIGQLTDYIREKLEFDDKQSWENFKRDYSVNYFYQKPPGVGGAKDIPQWINIVSCGLSLAIGAIGIFTSNVYKDNCWFILICFGLLLLTVVSFFVVKRFLFVKEWYKKYGITIFILVTILIDAIGFIVGKCLGVMSDETLFQGITIFCWLAIFQICILITPHYDKEIELANCVLEFTRAKLRYKKNENNIDSVLIFDDFLKNSSVLQFKFSEGKEKCRKKEKVEQAKLIKYCGKCIPIFRQLEMIDYKKMFFKDVDMKTCLEERVKEMIEDEG